MTTLRNFLMSAGFAVCLPAMADTPLLGATIDFEQTAAAVTFDPFTGIALPGPAGDGHAVGAYYASGAENAGVTFDQHALSFYSGKVDGYWNSDGLRPENLPQPSGAENWVFMSPYRVPPTVGAIPDCFPGGTCTVVSTVAEVTRPYSSVTFSFTGDSGSSPFVNIWSGPSATGQLMGRFDGSNYEFNNQCQNSDSWFCDWHSPLQPITIQLAPGQTNWSIEFGGKEGSVFFDNIVFEGAPVIPTLVPEPASLALALLGLAGVGVSAGRRRQRP